MGFLRAQFQALGAASPPGTVVMDGAEWRLDTTFKHDFLSAVGLYRCGDDAITCKFYRQASFFGVPLAWLGRVLAAYEATVMRQVCDLEGVPAFRGHPRRTAVAREFVPGKPLLRNTAVGDDFFPALLRLLDHIHQRGIAYVDLEKGPNILVGEDGKPYLIDFQVAFYVPEKLLGQTELCRLFRRWLQRADDYHALKHYRRSRPDQLTPRQLAASRRRPGPVWLGNVIIAPWKGLRRRILRR